MPHPITAAALAVAADPPAPEGWAAPAKDLRTVLKPAGWPHHTVIVDLPQTLSCGRDRGKVVRTAPTPVLVVPESWLRALARQAGCPWDARQAGGVCRLTLTEGPPWVVVGGTGRQ